MSYLESYFVQARRLAVYNVYILFLAPDFYVLLKYMYRGLVVGCVCVCTILFVSWLQCKIMMNTVQQAHAGFCPENVYISVHINMCIVNIINNHRCENCMCR